MAIDLNAARQKRAAKREARGAGGMIVVAIDGENFVLPRELPASLLDKVVSEEFEIGRLLAVALKNFMGGKNTAENSDVLTDTLEQIPTLPLALVNGILDMLAELFGAEQWARYKATGPSIEDNIELLKGLVAEYGVTLGELFASPASSTSAGATSNPTSPASTPGSTLEVSGPIPTTPASSASVA